MRALAFQVAVAALVACGDAFMQPTAGYHGLGLRPSHPGICGRSVLGFVMQLRDDSGDVQGDRNAGRRKLLSMASAAAAALLLGEKRSHADIMDVVTGSTKRDDVLARLKVGKVYVPTLSCPNSTLPCWSNERDAWYDFPKQLVGYTKAPSGVQIKMIPPRLDLADFASKSPVPNEAEGTNNIQIFFAAYVVDGATSEQLADYYSEDLKNRKSKYFDLRNRDPRLFQMGSVLVNLGKSNLIPGLEQGLAGMKVGERRSVLVPPEKGYGERGSEDKTFLRTVPPNATLLIYVEIKKTIRG